MLIASPRRVAAGLAALLALAGAPVLAAGQAGASVADSAVSITDPTGDVASDGGVFAFKAPFRGSMGDVRLNKPVRGMVPYGSGYLMVAEDGGVFNFSDKPFSGSTGDNPPAVPMVSITALG
jgi:hypothetical protein